MFDRKSFVFRFLVFWGPPALIVFGALVLAITASIASKINILLAQNREIISHGEVIIENHIEDPVRDLAYLANNGTLLRFLDTDTLTARDALERDWIVFAREEGIYDQIRWIDETGMERVRIDHINGETVAFGDSLLQDKASRYYFQEARSLERGRIYVSPLDLNVEMGVVEAPEKPVIRFATPVFDSAGASRGVLVLNYLARPMLTELGALGARRLWLVDQDGYWLQGPSLGVEWGFMYGLPQWTMAAQYAQIWPEIVAGNEGQVEAGDGIWTFRTVAPFAIPDNGIYTSDDFEGAVNTGAGQSWYLVHFLPRAAYADIVWWSWFRGISASAVMLALLAVVSWRLTRSRMREEKTALALEQRNISLSDKTEALRNEVEARAAVERNLQSSVELYRAILRNSIESFVLLDRSGRIKEANDAFCSLIGRRPQQVIGRNIGELGFDEVNPGLTAELERTSFRGQNRIEANLRTESGQDLIIEVNLVYLYQTDDVFAFMRNITDEKLHIGELERTAYYDVLTDIPNRILLNDRLKKAMDDAAGRHSRMAVLFIDLDGFKQINDQFGHAAGDHLLITIAERFSECVRPQDTVARIGGDEFAVVLVNIASIDDCRAAAERLLRVANEAVDTAQGRYHVSASIGIAFYAQDEYADAETLLRRADQAMYQAKMKGKNRYHIARKDEVAVSASRYDAPAIGEALSRGEFELHYQPKVNAHSGAVLGVEALLRWNHPLDGQLVAGAFLPQVAQHPVSLELEKWVIRTAFAQLDAWNRAEAGLTISVNVSELMLLDAAFMPLLTACLAEFPHAVPRQIEIELPESNDLADNPNALAAIEAAAKLGFRFAIDNFGTGYSSLAQLRKLSVNTLKIDRSLIVGAADDPDNLSILVAIMSLAEALQCEVIAEGVEMLEQGVALRQLGCEVMQGHFIARPMPPDRVLAWIGDWTLPASWRDQYKAPRDVIQLLVSCTYHRVWARRLKAALEDGMIDPPELDPARCRFGMWLHSKDAENLRSGRPAVKALDELHDRLHEIAGDLVQRRADIKPGERAARIRELDAANRRMRDVALSIIASASRENGVARH